MTNNPDGLSDARALPEGMVPWTGGEGAPANWDRGPVYTFDDGAEKPYEMRPAHFGEGPECWQRNNPFVDIVGYTPAYAKENTPPASTSTAIAAGEVKRRNDIRRSILSQLDDDPCAHPIILDSADWDIVLEALAAGPKAASEDGAWRDMQHAPRDGTIFLLAFQVRGEDAPRVREAVWEREKAHPTSANGFLIYDTGMAWRPMPSLSAASEDGATGLREALVKARDLLMNIAQTPANVWYVATDDPEATVGNAYAAIEDALAASPTDATGAGVMRVCESCDGTGCDLYDGNPGTDCQVCSGRGNLPVAGEPL